MAPCKPLASLIFWVVTTVEGSAAGVEHEGGCPQSCTKNLSSWEVRCASGDCDACEACAEDAPPEARRIHGETVYGDMPAISEEERINAFNTLYGKWPLPQWLEQEIPSYTEAMVAREKEALAHLDRDKKWNAWTDLVQARSVTNLTERQWDVTRIPKHLHDKLLKVLYDSIQSAPAESGGFGVGGSSKHVQADRLIYSILEELKPMHEEWAGVPLEPTSAYGIRIYERGSTMVDHLDVLESHVISSVLHIDDDLDEDFPLEVQDVHGKYGAANLAPGEMVFYESAKCFHRRATPMKGRFHANVFLHYRPKSWLENSLTRDRIRLMVPPHWSTGKVGVYFTLSAEAPGMASLFWRGDEQDIKIGDVAPGEMQGFNTDIGYVWVAKPKGDDSTELGRWTMSDVENKIQIVWPKGSRSEEL